MVGSGENTKVSGGPVSSELFPGWEVMSQWEDDPTDPRTHRTLVRFYTARILRAGRLGPTPEPESSIFWTF